MMKLYSITFLSNKGSRYQCWFAWPRILQPGTLWRCIRAGGNHTCGDSVCLSKYRDGEPTGSQWSFGDGGLLPVGRRLR